MVQSGAGPGFGYDPSGVGMHRSSFNRLPHSATAISSRKNAVAQAQRTRPPQVFLGSFERADNKSPESESLDFVRDRWSDLPLSTREQITNLCRNDRSPGPSPKTRNVERASSRFSHQEHVSKNVAKVKAKAKSDVKPVSLKRKAFSLDEYDDDSDDGEWCQPRDLQVQIHIAKENEVIHFLHVRFSQIQQLATKAIAKAWIKAICPKKQANFPYVDSKPKRDDRRGRPRYKGAPRVPKFWPLELCRHREPDHTRKSERTHLLVHLLRLCWTEKEWLESNGPGVEVPNLVKAGCWVSLLKEAFPPSKLDEVQCSRNPEKAALRKQYLNQIYNVAQQEENLRQGNGAVTDMVQYSAGPGWIPTGSEIPRPAAKRNPGRGTPSNAVDATGRSDSHSYAHTDTPDSDGQQGESRSASPESELDFAREGKVEQSLPFDVYDVDEAPHVSHKWKPDEDSAQNVGQNMRSVDANMEGVLSTPVAGVDYGSVWSDCTRSGQASQALYDQIANTTPGWFTNPECGFDRSQQMSSSAFPPTTAREVHNDYCQDFGDAPLQERSTSRMAFNQVQFTPGYGGMQSMGPSGPFPHTVVGTADDFQSMEYGVSGFRYANTFGNLGDYERYPTEQHQSVRGGWR